MGKSIFVIGGCRSGKSSHALALAERRPGNRKIFMATCVPRDSEMQDRVARHQRERGSLWETLEIPVRIADAIGRRSADADVILVDCLTLWISNLMLDHRGMDEIIGHVDLLARSVEAARCPVILVSNEVGAGIVPENDLARFFRDAVGFANQRIADCCNRVIWMVAGIPVAVKQDDSTAP